MGFNAISLERSFFIGPSIDGFMVILIHQTG
jgi:hypothetical protein